MSKLTSGANKIQGHPLSIIVLNIAALIGGIVALFLLIDIVRRLFS